MTTAVNDADFVRIAIISDVHAFDKADLEAGDSPPSYFEISASEADSEKHPIGGLLQLIRAQNLTADLVLSPGDLGDKSNTAGIAQAWSALHRVGHALGAKLSTAVCGNHDLDSRHVHNHYDPRGFLMDLAPRYPLEDEDTSDKYWARNYAIVELDRARLVLLNTCGYHTDPKSPEIQHGRISEWTLKFLEKDLQGRAGKPVNLLLCHHHPQQLAEINYEDYERMKGGDSLLALLSKAALGQWLIVHGHKHFPKLAYSPQGNSGPTVFSAGSFSACLYEQISTLTKNQFYLINIPITDSASYGLVGEVRAWDWGHGVGWRPAAASPSALSHRSGFGFKGSLPSLAQSIAAAFTPPVMNWSQIRARKSEVKYLIPADVRALHDLLSKNHKLTIIYDHEGSPIQIGASE